MAKHTLHMTNQTLDSSHQQSRTFCLHALGVKHNHCWKQENLGEWVHSCHRERIHLSYAYQYLRFSGFNTLKIYELYCIQLTWILLE